MSRLFTGFTLICGLLALSLAGADSACAQPSPAGAQPRVVWQVKNRFRLFREEKDFLLHVEALRAGGILAAEQALARESEGRGWARNMVGRLCIDGAGRILDPCPRDGGGENYLAPDHHRVGVQVMGADGAHCAWLFDNGEDPPQTANGGCDEEIVVDMRYGRTTVASAEITRSDGSTEQASTEIAVRDLLIAGLGDSVASGEGNPDRPVALADDGFCFHQFIAGAGGDYVRPGRAGFKADKSCDQVRPAPETADGWARLSARWLNAACHRSLYSYQLRAALALAAQAPHVAVTFLPLACTGATIANGIFGSQRPRELYCGNGRCPAAVPGQLAQLRELLATARRRDPNRQLDLVLLTVGANDVDFSGLVADVIIDQGAVRALFARAGVIGNIEAAQAALEQKLPGDFARLRAALKPLLGGDLSRAIFVSYGHPALTADGGPCPGGRDGFDVHPSFAADGERLNRTAAFVQGRFLPRLKALATCMEGTLCDDPDHDRMSFVDAHQRAFAGHGVCARADSDPAFDKECFSPAGDSFPESPVDGMASPLACRRAPGEFRAYASRARWIRTANDSYFAAMTFPQGVSSMRPADIHDASWGVLSAVYGGAIHPTAEGQAAMADAALAEIQRLLAIVPVDDAITAQPLPAPDAARSP